MQEGGWKRVRNQSRTSSCPPCLHLTPGTKVFCSTQYVSLKALNMVCGCVFNNIKAGYSYLSPQTNTHFTQQLTKMLLIYLKKELSSDQSQPYSVFYKKYFSFSHEICLFFFLRPTTRRKAEPAPVSDSGEARKKFGDDVKAISSDMYFGKQENSEVHSRYRWCQSSNWRS